MDLRYKNKNLQFKNKGFTLIELLVVVAVIALLSAVGLVAFQSGRQKSRDAKRLADMTQLATTMELFFNTNAKTALIVGQARGAILLTAEQLGLHVFGYTPLQVKVAVCGYGHAEKQQVQFMVKKLLNLDHTPKPDDAADALAIAVCHSHSYRLKSLS